MILELHRQGVSISAIARRVELDRKTVRRYIAQGLEPPAYGPRTPRVTQLRAFEPYLRERLAAFPQLTGRRLHRELRDLGYSGGYTILTDLLREIRPAEVSAFEVRFETPPGRQAQVDFAHFRAVFAGEPGVERIIWLFSLVLGHSRMLWGRLVLHQDLQKLIVHVRNHSFRATGITAYLNAGGTLENAQAMAAHESPCTTKLYDRTGDETQLDKVERITIRGVIAYVQVRHSPRASDHRTGVLTTFLGSRTMRSSSHAGTVVIISKT
jgi:hypothetical protein